MPTLMSNYRTSAESKEILRLLQRSGTTEGNFFWQSFDNSKRVIPVLHIELDFVARDVMISFENYNFEVDPDRPIFVKLELNQTVFKVEKFTFINGEIHFAIPEEVKTLELRTKPRFVLPLDKDKTYSLKPVQAGAGNQQLKVKAIDICAEGIGIVVSEMNRSFLRNNRILWLTELGKIELKHPILAEVVYLQTYQTTGKLSKNKEVRAGLKLSGIIPEAQFEHFCNC